MKDSYGRTIDYMRISITDRCNLRCKYCMPCDIEQMKQEDMLSYEELLRLCRIAAGAGIRNIKVTGGEPLARPGCTAFLKQLKEMPGIESVTLTTNGVKLMEKLADMKAMELDGINISLDSLKQERFESMTGRDRFFTVWESVMEAVNMGLKVKLNCVPMTGFNEDEWTDFARLAIDYPMDVRFIEMMPIGYGAEYAPVEGGRVRTALEQELGPLMPVDDRRGNGPARYVKGIGMQGCIGFIEAVHQKFCSSCNRIRLTAEGNLKLCLYYDTGVDLRMLLRNGASDEDILEAFRHGVGQKPMEHHFYGEDGNAERRKMSQIGG